MAKTDEDQNNSEGGKLRSQLEQALKDNKALTKRLAVKEAGLDTSKPLVKFFVDNYDGDWEPEAFTAQAQEYGLIGNDDDENTGSKPDEADGVEGEDNDGSQEQKPDSFESMYDKVYNSTQGNAGEAAPSQKKTWQKAQSAEEFLQTYDGRTA